MNRDDVKELHCIAPITNVASILERGILSNAAAEKLPHESVAMAEAQARRDPRRLPDGRPLHHYANLYFDARNPMLFKLQARHTELCVLRIRTHVLSLPNVRVSDGNAASDYTRYYEPAAGIEALSRDLVFAEWWNSSDPLDYWRRKSARCAEVLVPDRVPPSFIFGAYVSCDAARATLAGVAPALDLTLNARLFFR